MIGIFNEKEQSRELLIGLISIRKIKVHNRTYGICGYIGDFITQERYVYRTLPRGFARRKLKELFKIWPEFSGDHYYPVKGGLDAYHQGRETGTLWSGSQGELRKSLLDFMIQQLENEIPN